MKNYGSSRTYMEPYSLSSGNPLGSRLRRSVGFRWMIARFLNSVMAAALSAAGIASVTAGTVFYDFSVDPTIGGSLQVGGNGANFAPWVPTGGNPGGFLALTYPQNGTFTSFVFPDIDQGKSVSEFTFETDLRIGNPTGDRAADGFSISFARATDPIFSGLPDSASTMGNWAGSIAEGGATTGIAIDFDTWAGNTLPDGGDVEGILVRVDNATVLRYSMPTRNGGVDDPTSIQTGPRSPDYWANSGDPLAPESWAGLGWAHLKVELDAAARLTVTYKNQVMLDHYQTTYFPEPGRLVLAGRTGGANEHTHFDNIQFSTMIAADSVPPTTPGKIDVAVAGARMISIHWPASTDTSGHVTYQLSRDGNLLDGFLKTPNYTDPNVAPGRTYEYSVVAIGASGKASPASATRVTTAIEVADVGFLLGEIYDSIDGIYPNSPTRGRYLNGLTFGDPGFGETFGNNYEIRVSGTLTPNETALYDFFIRSDDASRFLLNVNGAALPNPTNDWPIAEETGCCNAFQETGYSKSQTTVAPIALTAGKSYGFVFVVNERGGGDWGQVAWRKVGDATPASQLKPIQGTVLSGQADATGASITVASPPASVRVPANQPVQFDVSATSSSPYDLSSYTSSAVLYQWYKNDRAIPGANDPTYKIAVASVADDGAQFKVLIAVPGISTTTAAATLTVIPDTKTPTVLRVTSDDSLASATVVFSEPVAAPSATTAANYKFSGGLTVFAATRVDFQTIRLTTSRQIEGATYTLTVNEVQDNAGNGAAATTGTFTAWAFTLGKAKYEAWTGVGGTDVANLTSLTTYPNRPDLVEIRDVLEGRLNWADNYGARLSAFMIPPADGDYVFFISADQTGELWLSTDSNPANKRLIAKEPAWNDSRQWVTLDRRDATYPENRSDKFVGTQWPTGNKITLKANTRYYLEALQKEGGGGDNVGVTAKLASAPDPKNGDPSLNAAYFGTLAPSPPGIPPALPAGQTIAFGAIESQTYGGAPWTLNATASSGLPVSFGVVSGPATLNGNSVSFTGAGTVVVSASQAGDASYLAAETVTQSITVFPAGQTIAFGAIESQTYGGAPRNLNATASSGLPVSFSVVSGPATLNGNSLSFTGAGTVVVAASQAGSANFSAAFPVTQMVAVNRGFQTVNFGPLDPVTFSVGKTLVLTATSSAGLPVSFGVLSGPASLAGNLLTLSGPGSVVLAASQAGNDLYAPAEIVTQSLVVVGPVIQGQTISFQPLAPVNYSDALSVPLNAAASSGLPVSFNVVSGPGAVTGNLLTVSRVGQIVISANQAGDATFSPAPATSQILVINQGAQSIRFQTLAPVDFATDLTMTVPATASSGLPVVFEVVSGPGILSGNQLRLTGAGTLQIKASQPGDSNYLAADTVIQSLVIHKGVQVVRFAPPDSIQFFPSIAIPLDAYSTSGLPVSYRLESGPVSLIGSILAVQAPGVIVVSATQDGDSNYLAATPVSRTIRVQGRDQTISFVSPGNTTYAPGKRINLSATSTSDLAVSFTVDSGPATVDGNVLSIQGAGSLQITARQSGDSVYSAADPQTRTLQVEKASQVITFDPENSVALGSNPVLLGATATSSLPVSFAIQNGPGILDGNSLEVLGVGTTVIAADQPGDNNYLPATQILRTITVIPGIVVQKPSGTNTNGLSLQVFVDQGSHAQVEEAGDLGAWKTIQTISGQGSGSAVIIPVVPPAPGTGSRFWRVKITQ